jgi:hypothetical protein
MAWNKIFTDSLLQGYISRITNNLDIRIAMQNKHGTGYNEAGKAGYFLVYLWERTGRIKCCLKQSSLEHSFKIRYRSIPISRKPFLEIWGKISNKTRR